MATARPKAWYRYQRRRSIRRKAGIVRRRYGERYLAAWMRRGSEGSLSKNKIHCSCPMCSAKSSRCRTMADQRKILAMEDKEKDYNMEE